jgi:hypothetical protein
MIECYRMKDGEWEEEEEEEEEEVKLMWERLGMSDELHYRSSMTKKQNLKHKMKEKMKEKINQKQNPW